MFAEPIRLHMSRQIIRLRNIYGNNNSRNFQGQDGRGSGH